MNQKAAKLARRVNRVAGTLVKASANDPTKPHKLPRAVKSWWAAQDHRARGRATRVWRANAFHQERA